MRRTTKRIPDLINRSITKDFTQVPNLLLRNPEISSKAKTILCLLLSNKEGWSSYRKTLQKFMKEGINAIDNALVELERHGYLRKIKYRRKADKRIQGSIWAYTDTANEFHFDETIEWLDNKGLELVFEKKFHRNNFHNNGNHGHGKHYHGNQTLIIYNNKNTNDKNTSTYDEEETPKKNANIIPSQFEQFWKKYPRKIDKGRALTIWNKICSKKPQDRPTWKQIAIAIHEQKKSERWQDQKFIPHPATWLNQQRWLDDPAEMKSFNYNNNGTPKNAYSGKIKHEYKFST